MNGHDAVDDGDDDLDDEDDVQNVWSNFEIPDEVLAAASE